MAPVDLLLAVSVAALSLISSIPDGISNTTISKVRSNLLEIANASWELGTAAEALTELDWPSLSVFNENAFPPPSQLNATTNATEVLAIAYRVVAEKDEASLTLMEDGATGDPASLGVAVLLANWTRDDLEDTSFSTAAGEQLDYLLNSAPRADNGAISHRADETQLWADFIYMAPPFIAYFGVLEGGDSERSLLQEAFNQIQLYRDVLRDDNGLWRHIALGSWQDTAHWATGNAWAAAGMTRVLQTIVHSNSAENFTEQAGNLTEWIQEITTTAWSYQAENGTLLNVIDDETSFGDTAGTALLAAVTYRMAAYTNDTSLIKYANKAYELVEDSINDDGWLLNTVDPLTFTTPSATGDYSPEGQAFILLLEAARRDFVDFIQANSTIESDSDDDDSNIERRQLSCKLVL